MNTNDIAATVGLIVGASVAVGPYIKLVTDGAKATGKVPSGWAGIFALVIGALFGAAVGALTGATTGEWLAVPIGALGGLGAGAVAIGAHLAVTPGEPTTGTTAVVVAAPAEPAPPTEQKSDPEPVAPTVTAGGIDV